MHRRLLLRHDNDDGQTGRRRRRRPHNRIDILQAKLHSMLAVWQQKQFLHFNCYCLCVTRRAHTRRWALKNWNEIAQTNRETLSRGMTVVVREIKSIWWFQQQRLPIHRVCQQIRNSMRRRHNRAHERKITSAFFLLFVSPVGRSPPRSRNFCLFVAAAVTRNTNTATAMMIPHTHTRG